MDGEDLSCYDNKGEEGVQRQDDDTTLDQLEWELASETGRITGKSEAIKRVLIQQKSSCSD